MLKLKTPLGIVTIIGSPRIAISKPERDAKSQISESYKFQLAWEKLLQWLRTHDDPDDPDATILLKDLNPQDYRNRLQQMQDTYRTQEAKQVARREIKNKIEAIVMREYNTADRKRWMMTKIAKKYDLAYDRVRDIITKYS